MHTGAGVEVNVNTETGKLVIEKVAHSRAVKFQ